MFQSYVQDFNNAVSVVETLHTSLVQIVSAGFPHCKCGVSANFSCGNTTNAKFQNRVRMLKLFGIAKFQLRESVWNLGHPRISHCGNLKFEISGLKLC